MKRIITMAIAMLMITGMVNAQQNTVALVSSNNSKEAKKVPVFQFEQQTFDFSEIPQGKPVSTSFNFTNTGEAPLVITNVQTSCGCTVADYTKDVVLPGKTGYVKVTYNAANPGAFNKAVTLTSNTETGNQVLFIKGNVVAK